MKDKKYIITVCIFSLLLVLCMLIVVSMELKGVSCLLEKITIEVPHSIPDSAEVDIHFKEDMRIDSLALEGEGLNKKQF